MYKKSLGQNFLASEKIAEAIVEKSDVSLDDVVLEIGPGKGILTKYLLERGAKVIAVEKDNFLFKELGKKFKNEILSEQLELVHNDIMDFDIKRFNLQDSGYKIVANIPYNITGAILKHFLSTKYQPNEMVLMVQKEVGERILAKNSKESVLSISIKAYGKPYIVKSVSKRHFLPKPKVDSVVIKIDEISREYLQNIDEKAFFGLVKEGFKEKRKKLVNNLSNLIDKEILSDILKDIGVRVDTRAEDLALKDWREIYRHIKR